ncbi:MAG TPA: FAD-binding oxidoreductase [Candidatus Polarisedimenticolia bacterium]|jgi:glycine/D-amino acid oxidase-like deaminating enzyme|nr:FAD-binding oxidoreductase [Candidatus Polarisedimenticolia bacterium]
MKTAEVVIIGGGIQGASVAWHLSRRGLRNVVLLEKETLASGSSGRTGGVIRQHYSTPIVTEIARQARAFFASFDREVGGHSGFVQNGLVLMVGKKDREALQANVALGREHKVPVRMITAGEAQALVPGLNTEGAVAFAHEADAGYGDGYGTTVGFAQGAQAMGAAVLQKTPAVAIEIDKGRVAGVATPTERFATRTVVNAAGPWADRVAALAGVAVDLKLELIEEAVIRAPEGVAYPIDTPSVYDFVNGLSYRPEGAGQVMAEGNSYYKGPLDPEAYPTKPSDAYIEDVALRLQRSMPRLDGGTVRGGWAGLLEGSPDFHPILGPVEGVEGFLLCCGFSGHGFKEAPVTGRLIAECILDGRPSLDIAPLAHDRFRRKALLRSRYKDDPIMA